MATSDKLTNVKWEKYLYTTKASYEKLIGLKMNINCESFNKIYTYNVLEI